MSETSGCTYVVNPATEATCRKVCDPGESICPHHLLLTGEKTANLHLAEPHLQGAVPPQQVIGDYYACEQCEGTGWITDLKFRRQRCACREEDDEATERRQKMGIVRTTAPAKNSEMEKAI